MGSELFKSTQIIKVTADGNYPFSWQGGQGTLASGQTEGTLTMQRKLAGQGSFQAIDSSNLVISGSGPGNDLGFNLEQGFENGKGGARDTEYQLNVSGASTLPYFVTISPATH